MDSRRPTRRSLETTIGSSGAISWVISERFCSARVLETANLMQMSQISFHRRDAETQRVRRETQVSWAMADRYECDPEYRDEPNGVIAAEIRLRAYRGGG